MQRIKYWFWKNWYLAHFSKDTRPIAEMRAAMVYDLAFKDGGMAAVHEKHNDHVDYCKKKAAEIKSRRTPHHQYS